MGFKEQALRDSNEEMIKQALDFPANDCIDDITYDDLVDRHYMKAKRGSVVDHLSTPSGKIELYSALMEKEGYPPLPTYIPLKDNESYPFSFVPGPNHNYLNSTFSNNEKHKRLEKEFRVYMNEKDARKKKIADGDMVRIWNDQGECELTVSVGDRVLEGVLVTQGLWADSPENKWLINALTPDRIADMGGGTTFFSGRVDVERI